MRLFNERARFGAFFAFAGIALLAWVISVPAGWMRAAAWGGMIALVEVAIVLVAMRCEQALDSASDGGLDTLRWKRAHAVLAGLSGAAWGSAVWFIWTGTDREWYLAATCVLVGVGGVAMVTMASYRRTALLFFGGLYLLPMAHILLHAGPTAHFLEIGLLVAVVVQLGSTRELGKIVRRDVEHTAHNAALIQKLNALLIHDQLTGAYSRRYTLDQLDQLIAVRERHPVPASVIMFDLDHFKRINDGHGHAMGDRALCEAVQVVGLALRAGDILGRIGGEEFLVLLPQTDVQAAQVLAERLRHTLARTTIASGNTSLVIPASFGVAEVSPGEDLAALMARVDAALYVSKERGRNRVTLAPAPA